MSILSTSRGARRGIFSAIAIGAALAVVTPMAANAAPWISRGEGRFLVATLGGEPIDSIAALEGAIAELTDPSDLDGVTANTPLDASLLNAINITLPVTNINLFNSDIIQLGALGQYAQANVDGSSVAFSGTVSAADSLIGVNTVEAGTTSTPAPTAGGAASINIGTADVLGGTDLVNLGINIGAIAASAEQAASDDGTGAQTGDYVLADVSITVGGTLVAPVLGSLETPLGALIGVVNTVAGTSLVNPLSGGQVVITEDSLLAAAGVADLNDLPEGTDLLQFLPAALIAQVTASVNAVLSAINTIAGGNLVVAGLLAAAAPVINGLLGTLSTALSGPLGTAISAIAQLTVNNQTNNPDGSFTQNAITLGVGANGSIATVELANATVGPNSGINGIPIANTESLLIAGGIAAAAAGVFALVTLRRRGIVGAGADVR